MPFLMQEYNSERGWHCLCCEETLRLTYLSLSCGEKGDLFQYSVPIWNFQSWNVKLYCTLWNSDRPKHYRPLKNLDFLCLQFDTLKHSISCFHINIHIAAFVNAFWLLSWLRYCVWGAHRHNGPAWATWLPTAPPVQCLQTSGQCAQKSSILLSLFSPWSVLHPALWRLGNECGKKAVCIGEIKWDHVRYMLYWVSHFTLFCLSHWIIPLDGNSIPSM